LNDALPVIIITDEIDPLISEGQILAQKLESVGVKTKLKNDDGVTREFFSMGAVIRQTNDAEDFVAEELKQSFGNKTAQN
jgi:acetyl esterase